MFRISNGFKATGALAASGLAMTLLGACTPAKMGAAALVGDQRISTSQLNTAVQQWEQEYQRSPVPSDQVAVDPNAIPRSILSNLVQFKLMDAAAQRQGVRINEGALDTALGSPAAAQLRAQAFALGVPRQNFRDYMRAYLEAQGIMARILPKAQRANPDVAQAALSKTLAATGRSVRISVNPRYGTFNYNKGLITAETKRLSRPESATLPDQG